MLEKAKWHNAVSEPGQRQIHFLSLNQYQLHAVAMPLQINTFQ